ncbi:MAG: DUF58 domain-containing protein [Candidatus Nanohalobium sp.]
MTDCEEIMGSKNLRNSIDTEVKRVSSLFRFLLKYKRQFQPSGIEFSGLRQYLPSDDASRIDWKISAGKPDLFVKQYSEEINMDVFIIIDASDTMLFGTTDKVKYEYASEVAAALTHASLEANIDVGISICGDNGRIMVPQGGQVQYERILNELTDCENVGGTFNLEDALDDAIGQIKDNTAIFIVSDFLEVRGDWKPKMTLGSKKFRHIMTVMTRDLRDYKLPENGYMRFESASGSGDTMTLNTSKAKEDFEEKAAKQEQELQDKIEEGGATFLKLDTRDNFSAKFAEYFDSGEGDW